MSANFIGIDIGVSCALAVVGCDGGLIEFVDMPTLRDGPKAKPKARQPKGVDGNRTTLAKVDESNAPSPWNRGGELDDEISF